MHRYSEEKWRELGLDMVKTSDVVEGEAEAVVDVLVTGSLLGIDSHGVRALPVFTDKKKKSNMKIVKETPGIVILDADHAYGPFSAKRAMELSIEKAETQGIACCSIINGEWITNLFYYSLIAVEKNMIGIVTAREGPVCVPWGGLNPVTGTNPMSIGIPAGERHPIVLDFATTIVAQGHVMTNLLNGWPIPDGWLIDRQGKPVKGYDLSVETIDEFWETGGSLLPFGTYKGYGINVAIDALCGALNLTGTGSRAKGQGVLMTAIDVASFVPVDDFKAEVDRLTSEIKDSPLMPGHDKVLLPGEREFEAMEERKRDGIPIDEISWQKILDVCRKIGVHAEKIME